MRQLLQIAGIALALAALSASQAGAKPWDDDFVLNDPQWRKAFLGSYGFLSDAEPKVAPSELELLREVIDLMKVNPRAAAAMLQQQSGEKSSAALDFVLANLEFQNDQLDAAKSHYESALAKFPDFRRAHKNLGLLLVQQGSCPEALPHLSRAVELGDRDGRNYGLLGFCHLGADNTLAAEVAYRNAILAQPDTRDWQLGLARALLAMEHYKDAIALLSHLMASTPDDATLWMLQANAHIGLGEPMAAAVDLEAVRAMGKAKSQSLVLLGDIYMNAGMVDLAKNAYLEVIARDGDGANFETAYRAADLLLRTRANDQAEEILASIGRAYPKLGQDDELRVLTLRAKVARAKGRPKEAAKLLESIVKRDGTRGDALLELARYHESNGDRERAMLLLERAGNLEGFEYQALLDQAQLMVTGRDYARAAELLRKALQIRKEPRVEMYLARIEEAGRH